MIDVDVSFVNISAKNDDNNNNSPLGQNFSQICLLLNVILDQFMDCNAIIDHYTHMTVHKLDQNCI